MSTAIAVPYLQRKPDLPGRHGRNRRPLETATEDRTEFLGAAPLRFSGVQAIFPIVNGILLRAAERLVYLNFIVFNYFRCT